MRPSIGLYRIYDQTYVNNYNVPDSKISYVSRELINSKLTRGRGDYTYTLLSQTTFYLIYFNVMGSILPNLHYNVANL
jgi:hypothetical protein